MLNKFCQLISLSSVVLGASLFASSTVLAEPLELSQENASDNPMSQLSGVSEMTESLESPKEKASNNPMSQLTSVSELRDVAPTEWAYEALRSLVERYGCIVGYPDSTYRGNRALTRWEFAAGLNACLNTIERLIQENVAVLKEDIDTLKRLAKEFETELAALGGRVDNLEARVSFLEDHQFSTTTKLSGEVIFALGDAFSSEDGTDNQTVFQNRVWLTLKSSFTGEDALNVRLSSNTAALFDIANTDNTPTAEGRLTYQFDTGSDVFIGWLGYYLPIGDRAQLYVAGLYGIHSDYVKSTANPFLEDFGGGDGALSYYAQDNSIYNIGGGSGAGFTFDINDFISLNVGYLAGGVDSPANADEGNGFLNGSYAALGQVTLLPFDGKLQAALTYVNSYHTPGTPIFSYGPDSPVGVSGTIPANFPGGNLSRVSANSYGLSLSYQISDGIAINAWGSYTDADIKDGGDNGEIWNYALALAFPDAFAEGNLAGLIVGVEPYLGNAPDLGEGDDDLPIHIEGFYRFQLNDSISLTPGLIYLVAPNQDDSDYSLIGTVRMTFNF
jgi:Carbohydrate-selective porin, OprB family/S-layer homology domain